VRRRLADELELARHREVPISRAASVSSSRQLLQEPIDLMAVVAAPGEAEARSAETIEVLPVHREESLFGAT